MRMKRVLAILVVGLLLGTAALARCGEEEEADGNWEKVKRKSAEIGQDAAKLGRRIADKTGEVAGKVADSAVDAYEYVKDKVTD